MNMAHDAKSVEQGLFWRALRAPAWELASKEFNGTFTKRAAERAAVLSALLLWPWFFVFGMLAQVLGDPVSQIANRASVLPVAVLAGAGWAYLWFVALSAGGAFLMMFFDPRMWPFRATKPGDLDALDARTATRWATVHFARFLRRLVFPWEWFLGRP